MYCKHQTQKASGWVSSAVSQPHFIDILDELRIENPDLQVLDNLIVSLTVTSDIKQLFLEKKVNRSPNLY